MAESLDSLVEASKATRAALTTLLSKVNTLLTSIPNPTTLEGMTPDEQSKLEAAMTDIRGTMTDIETEGATLNPPPPDVP